MDKRKNRLLLSVIIGIILSALFAYFIPNIETGFSCIYCDFYTYRNDWIVTFESKMPHWDGSLPFPEGFYTFEQVVRRFYFYLSLKIFFVGCLSTFVAYFIIQKLQVNRSN